MAKLTREQKLGLRDAKEQFKVDGGKLYSFSESRITVATMREFPNAKMLKVSVAVCSDTERKFSKKAGAYVALFKMYEGEFMQFPVDPDCEAGFVGDLIPMFDSYFH